MAPLPVPAALRRPAIGQAPAPPAPVAPDAARAARGARVRWRDDRSGLVLGAVFALAVAVPGYVRHVHHWSVVDLALFDQAAWLLSRGRAPELTVLRENLFGDHVSLVVVGFAPLYRLVPTPLWFVAAQALALGATVPAMRALARQEGASPAWATVATVASAPLWAAATFDVHPVVLGVPVVAAAIAAARRDDPRAATCAGLLLGVVRADACVMLLGAAVLAGPRARRPLVAVAALGSAVGVAVPTLLHSEQTFARYWGHLGDTPLDAALHPWRLLGAAVRPSVLETALIWLLPVGFLVLGRARWAAALAVAGAPLLLSSAPATSVPWFHHAAPLAPFAIGGALVALAHRPRRLERPAVLVAGLVVALLAGSPFAPSNPPDLRIDGIARPRPVAGLDRALAGLGPEEGVAAEVWLLPHVAHRPVAFNVRDALDADDPAGALAAADVVLAEPRRVPALRALGWQPVAPAEGDDVVALRPRR